MEKLKESEFRENMPEIQSSPRDIKSLTSRKKSMKPPQSASHRSSFLYRGLRIHVCRKYQAWVCKRVLKIAPSPNLSLTHFYRGQGLLQ